MRADLIPHLNCPYCGGSLRVTRAVEADGERIRNGLVECRCFVFPVVEGILLLSLSKGYGGAEEALQPYVPLQAAAVTFLGQGRAEALRHWIRRHIPLADLLLNGDVPYLEFSSRLGGQLELEVDRFLNDVGRFGVLGHRAGPRRRAWRAFRNSWRRPRTGRAHQLEQLSGFYPARFFSPYAQSALLQLGQLPLRGRVLSLCCGHGMFENLLSADGRASDVVSVDGQFLNLLATRRYVRPEGQYICHDVQFGLPFADGAFDAVFSSTCLPEIPAQRLFAREAVRVTAPAGWTWFDCIWNGESGGPRITRDRYYRFAQNFFTTLDDYVPFFRECAGSRRVSITIPREPQIYRDNRNLWVSSPDGVRDLLGTRDEAQISALVTDPGSFPGFESEPARPWLSAARLDVSPVYDRVRIGSALRLDRRPGFEALAASFAPSAFPGYADKATIQVPELDSPDTLLERFCAGHLSLLPPQFDSDAGTLRRRLS